MVRMRRTMELGVLVMLVGMLLMARINCDSSVGDDEEDDEEPAVDEYETSGSSPDGTDESSPSVDRPAVETYRDDANKQAKQQLQPKQIQQNEDHDQEQEFMDTTVDSSSNQNYQDLDSDLDQDEDTDDFADPKESTQGGSSSSSSSQDNKPPQSNQPSIFTYQNNRSKLLNIIKKPGILAGIVGGAIIGILTAILLIMFIVYRMRKKDEGSYALEETKKPLNAYDYRHCPTKEFYA